MAESIASGDETREPEDPYTWLDEFLATPRPTQPTPVRQIAGLAVDLETTEPTFDLDHAVGFLDCVFGDVYNGRLGLSPLLAGGRWGKSEHFQWLRHGAARAAEWDTHKPSGIYFRTTMLPPEGPTSGRGGADDAHALAFWWADVDFAGIGHKPTKPLPLPPDEDAALELIADLPTPSLLVHSGGGFYPLWLFERPVFITDANRVEVKARSQRWQDMIHAKAERRGLHYGSGVGDLARVLRLPGSTNRKVPGRPRPCRVVGETGEVYPWG